MFAIALAIIGLGMVYGESGTNAATVGQQLLQPESSWQRYDDTDSMIVHSDGWSLHENRNPSVYKGIYYHNDMLVGKTIKLKFYGTKLRLLTWMWNDNAGANVKIDGTDYGNFSSYSNNAGGSYIFFEKLDLIKAVHEVLITTLDKSVISPASTKNWFALDAIDIDDTGSLLPIDYNKSISLDNSSMNLKVYDSQPINVTTTPAGIGVKWKSSNESVAKYDSSTGKVVAIGEGTCTITATIDDGYNVSSTCTVNVTQKTVVPTDPTEGDLIINTAHAKGDNTNNPSGEVTIIFHGTADTILSLLKTADVKDVWIGDNFTYTLVITNTGTKTAKSVVVNDPAPNHIDFNVSEVTTTQGTVDSSSTSKNIIVNVGDILPGGTVTIKIPSTVIA
jgi:uncharacterized repeat protein (TIGR01451 family)